MVIIIPRNHCKKKRGALDDWTKCGRYNRNLNRQKCAPSYAIPFLFFVLFPFLCLRKKKKLTHSNIQTSMTMLMSTVQSTFLLYCMGHPSWVPQSAPKKSQIVYHIIWCTNINININKNKIQKTRNGAQMRMEIVLLQHPMACMPLGWVKKKKQLPQESLKPGSIISARINAGWPWWEWD